MNVQAIENAIARLETYDKQGETYTNDRGSYGWRNPIRQDTGRILQALMMAANPKRILEIGTAHGLSALYLMRGTSPGCTMDTIEFEDQVAQQTQALMDELALPVRVHSGEAMDMLATLDTPYDVLFLDAQKSHYGKQFNYLVEQQLLEDGCLILADNVIDRAEECASFFEALHAANVAYTTIATECGLLVANYHKHG